MIIESDRADPKATDMTFKSQRSLAEVDHEVSSEFGALITMHQEICDEQVHVNDDLAKHLWARKGNAV
jgi:hypothetical protein